MKRTEHDDIEAVAMAAVIGLTDIGGLEASQVATRAFDIAEAFQQEKVKRIGEKSPFYH